MFIYREEYYLERKAAPRATPKSTSSWQEQMDIA